MLKQFIGFVIIIFVVSVLLIVLQILKIQSATTKLSYDNKPFVRDSSQAALEFLFMGDSTALGTGAQSNTQSVAGWFGQDFPQARIENHSSNGMRSGELVKAFNPSISSLKKYDLIVIQIGANDIFKFSSFKEVEQNITTIIERAKPITKNIVILHSGNVGLAPIFIWPFDQILTHRARQMRALYMKKAREENVLYVDLFTERSNDLFLKDINKYYAPDHLHPSGDGYRWWYERIRQTLDQAGVVLQ